MPKQSQLAWLLCLSITSAAALAETISEPPAANEALPVGAERVEQTANSEDLGVLQEELARVEAERQRLADELAGGNADLLQQAREQNRVLREQLQETDLLAAAQREEQRQRWFMIGGGTVAGALLVGFIIGRSGRRGQRREWLN
jgi:Skp family chaperone for outer membrane proteins